MNFTTEGRLKQHVRQKHTLTSSDAFRPSLKCNASFDNPGIICDQEFSQSKKFILHMKTVHQIKPWLCLQCPDLKRFEVKQNYVFHQMSHSGQREFFCDLCQKSFANPRQLNSHKMLHLGRRFSCDICGFKARSHANLRGHIKIKHQPKTLECEDCGRKFSTSHNLKTHQRIHTGENPYECEICAVKFKRIHHLKAHLESILHGDTLRAKKIQGVQIPMRKRRKSKVSHADEIVKEVIDEMVVIDQEPQSFVMLDGQTVEIIQETDAKIDVIVTNSKEIS